MAFARLLRLCAATMISVSLVTAHGGEHQEPLQVDPEADWATRHMAEEHHIDNFDLASFFALHDFDENGYWDEDEILKMYGMKDPTAKDVPTEKKDHVVKEIMKMFDLNQNGIVEKAEWMAATKDGKLTLPDFGLGPGHHWDMETEYEIHHWEKFHNEKTTIEELTHPEDIEHFRQHDMIEHLTDLVNKLDKMPIAELNIPRKFRRDL